MCLQMACLPFLVYGKSVWRVLKNAFYWYFVCEIIQSKGCLSRCFDRTPHVYARFRRDRYLTNRWGSEKRAPPRQGAFKVTHLSLRNWHLMNLGCSVNTTCAKWLPAIQSFNKARCRCYAKRVGICVSSALHCGCVMRPGTMLSML